MNLIRILLFLLALPICANNKQKFPVTYSVMHLQNTLHENPNLYARMLDPLNINHHAGIHNFPNNNIDLPGDYIFLKTPDGRIKLTFKDYLPGYKAYFDINMLHTTSAVSWLKRKLSYDYNNSSYFAQKFDRYRPTRVFHCVGNYRYQGFRDYVKRLPGFENFILDLGKQLKPGCAIHKKLAQSDNLQDFAALKNMYQEKMYELKQKAQAKQQADLRKNLSARGFNTYGLKLLEHHGIADQFSYTGNLNQATQLKQITSFMNDVGEFRHEYHKTPELNEIADNATSFGVLANNATRESLPSTSQSFLEIGQNLLALGRGLVAGCERNVTSIYHMVRHPIDTGTAIAGLIKNIGIGIGNVTTMLAKNEVGHLLNDQSLIDSAQQDMDLYINSTRQIYQYAKKAWQDKSKIERYELVGNLAADLLLAKGLPVAGKLVPIKNLAQYKPIAFAKLGNVGREINQIAGLTCAKGAKAVERGFEVIKNYPQIIQDKQLLGEAVWYGNKCLNASNNYLRQLNKHALKCVVDTERRLVRAGEHVKKLPKSCIAKTKQILAEEVLVTDTLGNVWRSKIGEPDWVTELSEQGKLGLALLNETTAGFKGAARETFQHYRTIPYGAEAREALNVMKWQFRAVEQEMRAIGKTFKNFYGQHITDKLGNELIHFKGKDHLFAATIKRTPKASGITERVIGLHWDFGRKLEQLGVYSLNNVEHLAGGMYEATLNYAGVIKKGKTFFPSHWDANMLASKISEACYNTEKINFKKSEKVLEIIGNVSDGFKITVKIDKKGKILTAFPLM